MIGLFFEVQTRQGHRDQYLELAASLRPALDALGGCLFIDRFQSLSHDNLLLSYQIWQDEGALTAWRVHARHHRVQEIGREAVFSDYRIRIAQVIHEARPNQPVWQPERRTPYNDPARRAPTYVLAAESKNDKLAVTTAWHHDAFASVYREGQFAHLIDVPDPQAAIAFGEKLLADTTTEYVRIFEVMRDYGMYRRSEAPQYYPPVERSSALSLGLLCAAMMWDRLRLGVSSRVPWLALPPRPPLHEGLRQTALVPSFSFNCTAASHLVR